MEEVAVSVICITYNHKNYIRRALDGFVSQRTNFKFEVIVHDDASTDGTADIVREYAEKYSDIIKPIFQVENQYSKGKKIIKDFVFPYLKGKYVAFCEGDDYWCDADKLQLQYDAMEKNLDCSVCMHYVKVVDVNNGQELTIIPEKKFGLYEGVLTKKIQADITLKSFTQLSSFFMRANYYKDYLNCNFKYKRLMPTGDISLFLYFLAEDKMYFIERIMSVYNKWVEGSWSCRVARKSDAFVAHKKREISALESYLEEINPLKCIEEDINYFIMIDKIEVLYHEHNFKELIKKRYKKYIKTWPLKMRVKIYIGVLCPNLIIRHDNKIAYERK